MANQQQHKVRTVTSFAQHLHSAKGFTRLVGTSMMMLGARVGGALLGIALQILIARAGGAHMLGAFYLALGLATVLAILGSLGYPWLAPRIVADADGSGQPSRLAAFARWTRQQIWLLSGSLAALATLVLALAPGIPTETRTSLIFGALTAPFFAAMRLNGALANALRQFPLAYLPELLWRPMLLLLLAGAFAALRVQFDLTLFLAGHLAIAVALSTWQSRRIMSTCCPQEAAGGKRAAKAVVPPEDRQSWRRQALPLVIAILFINQFADLDTLLVGSFLPPAQLAAFGAALRISTLFAFSIQLIHQIVWRDLAEAIGGPRHNLRALLLRTNVLTVAMSAAAVIFAYGFGSDILGAFGPGFADAKSCLVLLLLAQVVRAAAGPSLQVLSSSGKEAATVPVFAAAIVLLVALNVVLLPLFGILGAAAAVLFVTIFWCLCLNMICRWQLGISVGIETLLATHDGPKGSQTEEMSPAKLRV